MAAIVVFYYIEQYQGWEISYHKHLHDLQVSGLYDACEKLFIINNGTEPLCFDLDKITLLDKSIRPLDHIYKYCTENPDANVLYLENMYTEHLTYNSHRLCSEYFTIYRWQECVELLFDHDLVGTEWQPSLNKFLINNWWARGEYIQTLTLSYLYHHIRLGINNARHYSFFDSDLTDLDFLSPLEYIKSEPDADIQDDIAIFYHVGQLGNWQHVYQEQIHHLVRTGLYQAANIVHLGVNGNEALPFLLPKMVVSRNPDQILEANTLESLWQHCNDYPESRVLYIHTKGVTRTEHRDLKYSTYTWRTYLEHFTIHCWRHNLTLLQNHDCVGTEWRDQAIFGPEFKPVPMQYYDGNFWWARADYVSKLKIAFLYGDTCVNKRMNSEFWIGTAGPRYHNYLNYTKSIRHKNIYFDPQLTHKYVAYTPKDPTQMTKKKAKIVAVVMFRNEARVLRRMLDSCLPYVDYYVFQNNGSTDGSDEIAKNFLLENKLSGTVYEVEEGWVGFGWNRDHLVQYCQKELDHGCDWILKMDCDEVLEVDPDFDWSILDDTSIQAFHVPAIQRNIIYYRAWLWNARLPWRFNHDLCHETIYCEIPEIGAGFQRVDLPTSFRQIGYNEGQSWSVPTKFATDALLLEERMIREHTMLSNLYHFWYIGKSYTDAWPTEFELGEPLRRNFAERAIFYFKQYVERVHGYYSRGQAAIDELAYMGLIFSAEAYRYLGDPDSAIKAYEDAGWFAPPRNDHIWGMATLYREQQQYDKMLTCTSIMMQPERVNPFPVFTGFIDKTLYHDGGTRVQELHQEAQILMAQSSVQHPFAVNQENYAKRLIIVDDFYANPDQIRDFALAQEYEEDLRWYKGLRSKQTFATDSVKQEFERLLGCEVFDFYTGYNGCFQVTTADNPQVYHYDQQRWAAMIYLTPDAPVQSGTRLHKSKINGTRHSTDPDADAAFNGNFYDSTKFDVVDQAGNVYNRLVLMDARSFHSAGPYFGDTPENGRLIQLFFFN